MKSMIWIYLGFFGIMIQFQESTRKNRYEITITSDNKFFPLINYKWSNENAIKTSKEFGILNLVAIIDQCHNQSTNEKTLIF